MADQNPIRGLGALLQKTTERPANVESDRSPATANVDEIRANPDQPRKDFDEDALNELSNSIKEKGLLQPVVVRRLKGQEAEAGHKFEIIAGERRWRATKKAGLAEIPILVKDVEGKTEILLLSLIENLQRDNLNPMEEAESYITLKDNFGLTQEQVSTAVSKSRPYVANAMRLCDLPKDIQQMLRSSRISVGHAKVLLGVEDPTRQIQLAKSTVSDGLTVRQLEATVSGAVDETEKPKRKMGTKKRDPHLNEIEDQLRNHFGTKVSVVEGTRKGKIIVEFYSVDDFDRITKAMGLIK